MAYRLPPGAVRRLRRWLATSFQSRSYLRFDGLAIDRIDPELTDPSTWLAGGRAVLLAARSIRDELNYPLTVAVTFALAPVSGSQAGRRLEPDEINDHWDETAPAVALFPAEPEFLCDLLGDSLDPSRWITNAPTDVRAMAREWSFPEEETGETFRTVLLYSLPSSP